MSQELKTTITRLKEVESLWELVVQPNKEELSFREEKTFYSEPVCKNKLAYCQMNNSQTESTL